MFKKILLLTITTLILLSLITAQRPPVPPKPSREQNIRDFVSGFFNTLNGNFTLDTNCIGDETKQNIHEIIDNFHQKKILKIVENLQKIAMITMKTCPIQETEKYVEDKFTAIKQGYYFDNFKKNFFKIAEVVMHEVNNKQKNAYSVGTACAQIEKMTIYKQQQLSQFKFLALESIPAEMAMPDFNIDLEGFKKFFKGVLEGVSKVPFGENICYTSAIDIKIEEVKLIAEHLYAAIKERDGKKFYEAVKEVLAVLEKLENANEHCDISGLIKSIGVYATPYVRIRKLLYNIASHYSLYWGDIKEGYSAFGNKEWEKAGHAIGHFASTLLSWTTS